MLNNQYHGITVEDLEKAASVRLFEKAAAAEGINLNELSEAQVDELYSNYQQSSEENTMNEEIFDLFEKQAAYEGVDLEALSDDELAYVFNNFVGNLESELEDDVDYDEDDYGYDEEEEAYEKLAEAEILGRHMARAYMDELEKEAESAETRNARKTMKEQEAQHRKMQQAEMEKRKGQKRLTDQGGKSFGAKLKELATGHDAAEQRALKRHKAEMEGRGTSFEVTSKAGLEKGKKAKAAQKAKDADRLKSLRRMERAKGYGKRGLVAAAVGGAGYGAKKMMEKEAANEAIYGLAYERAEDFVKEGSVADYDGSFIDQIAIDILADHGYYIED